MDCERGDVNERKKKSLKVREVAEWEVKVRGPSESGGR